ncbi:unnamed protein product [Diatraea saccharalis]|uniref:Uncharacterized protein n=1 Tax=Diatraea saccharalis TaxID=40085 RepID=A0A9N9QXR6_9NEOP|nr:unnamed protein product [Diatraea saccharalis]
MFRKINASLSIKGINEVENQADNRMGQMKRMILSPLPTENNKLLYAEDPLTQQVQDYCSDDSVKNSDYVNTDDYYSDSNHNTKRTYIEGGKTVTDLHRDYVAECKSKGLPFGNYLAYYNIFCSEYKMAFFKPKKECENCTNYANATEEDKKMKHDYELHLKEKQLARDQKDEDKNIYSGQLYSIRL